MSKKENQTIYIFAIVIALIVGFAFGTVVEITPDTSVMDDDHPHVSTLLHEHDEMTHETFEISSTEAPTIELTIHTDPKAGWNLQVKTHNFTFAPENASMNHVYGEGHAHLYIDDVKITRLYGEWYHIPELTPGNHTIRVDLNTNDHMMLQVEGVPISDSVTVTV